MPSSEHKSSSRESSSYKKTNSQGKLLNCEVCGDSFRVVTSRKGSPKSCKRCFLNSLDLKGVYRYLVRLTYDEIKHEGIENLLGYRVKNILGNKNPKGSYQRLIRELKTITSESTSRAQFIDALVANQKLFIFTRAVAIHLHNHESRGEMPTAKITPILHRPGRKR